MAKKTTTIASAAPSGDDAPKKKIIKTTNSIQSNKDLIASFMKHSASVDKELTSYGSTLESSIYSNIEEYIDTGSYAMNRLISGSIFGGIPSGRVIAFAGECVGGDTLVDVKVNGEHKKITIKELVESNL